MKLLYLLALPLLAKEIRFVETATDILQEKGKEILVSSFMDAYEDVPLQELNPSFKSIRDVRSFYENYFVSEFGHFQHGELIWVQAFEGDELVGWATFQLEKNEPDAAYMNLLVVDPKHQGKGYGKQLVFSICDLYPNTKAINVLLRKVNEEGRKFYEKIGFIDYPYKGEDNFVDNSLLTGLRWENSPPR